MANNAIFLRNRREEDEYDDDEKPRPLRFG
jgi:hypothetical protein